MGFKKTLASLVLSGAMSLGLASRTVSASESVYWTELNGKIMKEDADYTNSAELVYSTFRPRGIALDTFHKQVYWTNDKTGTIERGDMDGKRGIETLVKGIGGSAFGIALDVPAGKMYWTEGTNTNIKKANLDGSHIETIYHSIEGLNYPHSIALDTIHRKMYVANFDPGKILRADLDGKGYWETLATGLNGPTDVALDLIHKKIYWCLPYSKKIVRANLDGSQTQIVSDRNVSWQPQGIALDLINNKMYFGDVSKGKVFRADLDGSNPELFYQGEKSFGPTSLAATFPIPKPPTSYLATTPKSPESAQIPEPAPSPELASSPEPSTLSLLEICGLAGLGVLVIGGLAGLGVYALRKKQK